MNFSNENRKEKIIDAEIVGEENKLRYSGSEPKDKSEKSGIISAIGNRVSKFLGLDRASREKRERKKALNTSIDKMMEGTGLAGALMGSMMKTVGGIMAESISQSSEDIQFVTDAAENCLYQNNDVTQILGANIRCGNPFSSSFSSSNINGQVSKNVMLVMPVSGVSGRGQIQVQASLDGGDRVDISQLIFQSDTGRSVNVVGSGRGRGGSRGTPGRGQVIDVETM